MRRDPQRARRPASAYRGGRGPRRRPERQPWPPSPPRRARRWPLSPVGTGLLTLTVVSLGGLVPIAPLLPLLVLTVLFAGLLLAAVVIVPRELFHLVNGRTAATAVDPAAELDWSAARQRFDRLRGEYAGYECDPIQVLRLPALADVTVPSTARFVDAIAEAQALRTDRHPGERIAARFAGAVEHAEQAWRAARDAAGRIRLSALTSAERTTVERVVTLLTVARETDNEPERLIAYSRARTELAKLDRSGAVHVPPPAQAAVDDAARGALPG